MSSNSNLFTLLATRIFIHSSSFIHYKSASSVAKVGDTTLEFVVLARSKHYFDYYFDLDHTMLYLQAKIVTVDKAGASTEDAIVGPTNKFMRLIKLIFF